MFLDVRILFLALICLAAGSSWAADASEPSVDLAPICEKYEGKPFARRADGKEVPITCAIVGKVSRLFNAQADALLGALDMEQQALRALQHVTFSQLERDPMYQGCRFDREALEARCSFVAPVRTKNLPMLIRISFNNEGYVDHAALVMLSFDPLFTQQSNEVELSDAAKDMVMDLMVALIGAHLKPEQSIRKHGDRGIEIVFRAVETG